MKLAIALTLTASLVTSSLPAQAQPRYLYSPRATDWLRVRALPPGSPVTVSAVGLGGQDKQYFVSATGDAITLLVLGNADLPRGVRRLVIKLAATHPEFFTSPSPARWAEFTDGSARVNPDGLFVHRRKVADLGEVVKTIDAGDVAEVTRPSKRYQPAPPDMDPRVIGAALLPLSAVGLACRERCSPALAWGLILGLPVAAGIVAAARAERRRPQELVYRAP